MRSTATRGSRPHHRQKISRRLRRDCRRRSSSTAAVATQATRLSLYMRSMTTLKTWRLPRRPSTTMGSATTARAIRSALAVSSSAPATSVRSGTRTRRPGPAPSLLPLRSAPTALVIPWCTTRTWSSRRAASTNGRANATNASAPTSAGSSFPEATPYTMTSTKRGRW